MELLKLKKRLQTLAIFRTLWEDTVITSLMAYLDAPDVSRYAAFVSALYGANGGNLSEHIRELCENSENVYVKAVGRGETVPQYMADALCEELKTLQMLSDCSQETLCAPLGYEGFLPGFAQTALDLAGIYLHRVENIGRYGYGIYAKHHMFCIDEEQGILPVRHHDRTRLCDLVGYEREKKIVLDNTRALLAGKPAANVLLTGDAGTGKSSTVKAVANELFDEGLRIIEVRKDQLRFIPKVLDELSANPLKFILFIDDLSFLKDDDHFNALKAVLEGSVSARSRNVVIYATSNRRHIIKEKFSDREGDEIHRNDTLQETLSLSERFGIHVTFSRPSKANFLKIVQHLAEDVGFALPNEQLESLAEQFALERGGRSPRLARQFIEGQLAKER